MFPTDSDVSVLLLGSSGGDGALGGFAAGLFKVCRHL